ncbi:hypothetical protein LEMLEM_LOCUS18832 [Lemmus lemmus]
MLGSAHHHTSFPSRDAKMSLCPLPRAGATGPTSQPKPNNLLPPRLTCIWNI